MKRSLALLSMLLAIPSCTPSQQEQQNGPAELRVFSSPADLERYVQEQYLGPDTRTPVQVVLDNLRGTPRVPASMPSYYPGTAVSYDPVTVSVGGLAGTDPQALRAGEIDAARLVGDYLYVLNDFGLSILKAVPADQMTVVGHFDTPATAPTGLYPLDGGRLTVLTSSVNPYASFSGSDQSWLPLFDPYYDVYIVDVNDPAAPTTLARYSIQGNPVTARVVSGTSLVLLSASYPGGDPYSSPRDITNTAPADLLPTCRLTDATGHQTVVPLLSWDTVLRPANADGGAILTITTIDLTNPGAAPTATGMVGYWDTAYATPTSVYLTNTAWLPDGSTPRSDTELHRFDLNSAPARYAGSVKLPSRPLPGSGFGEKDGLLRVATSTGLFVLAPGGGGLQIAGQLDDLALNIQLIGVEYIGNYAGFAGFDGENNVSILVDLTDPQHPTSLGNIAVSPYAGYVHLLDATHALAIGSVPTDPSDPAALGWDFNLMMYSVPSVAGTTLTHSLLVGSGGTSSDAVNNREDLFLSDGLLILPVNLYEGTIPYGFGLQTFGGLYLYHIDTDTGFTPLGRIETADPYGYVAWNRAIVKDGTVYAVTNVTVQAASVDTPGQILAKVRLP